MNTEIKNSSETTNTFYAGKKTMKTTIIQNGLAKSLGVSFLAMAMAMAPMSQAFAASPASIDNTATVTDTPPVGPALSIDSNTVEVDLIDPTNSLSITKSAALTTDGGTSGLGDAGDRIFGTPSS